MTAVAIRETSGLAVDELIETHVSLVGHLVRDLSHRLPAHIHRDDLVSAGTMALVLAARSFDPELGVSFARYASIRIKGALTDELRSLDWASRGVRSRAREVDAVRNALAAQLGRAPTRHQIARAMGVSRAEIDAIDAAVHRADVVSLQGLSGGEAERIPAAIGPGPEARALRREELDALGEAIHALPERLRFVVERYFFAEDKLADIGRELGVSESRVSQLCTEALGALRGRLRTAGHR